MSHTSTPSFWLDLRSDYSQWYRRVTTFGFEPLTTELGHNQWPLVQLLPETALKAEPPSESLTERWPLKIVREGTYLIEIDYRCSSERPVKLSWSVNETAVAVSLQGSEDWRTQRLGEAHLSLGSAELLMTLDPPAETFTYRRLQLRRK